METTARNRTIGGIVIGAIILILLLVLFSCTVNSDPESSPKKDPTTGESSLPSDPDTLEPDDKPSESDEADADDIVPAANTGVTFIPAGNVPSGSTPTCELDPSACEDTRPPGAGVDICEIRPDLAQCQEPEPTPPPDDDDGDTPICDLFPDLPICDDGGEEPDPTDTTKPTCGSRPVVTDKSIIDLGLAKILNYQVSWGAASDDSGSVEYRIVIDGEQVDTTSQTSYGSGDIALDPTKEYRLSIEAVDPSGNDAKCGGVKLTDNEAPDMGPVECEVISSTEVKLTWDEAQDDSGEIQYYTVSGGPEDERTETPGGTFTGLTPGTDYTFGVVATDWSDNDSEESTVDCSTPADEQNPTAPTGLTVTSVTSTSASLAWTASEDDSAIDHYEVTYSPVDGGLGRTEATDDAGTSYTVTTLLPETAYKFTVVAVDVAGNKSGPSNEATVTTTALGAEPQIIQPRTLSKSPSGTPDVKAPVEEPTDEKAPLLPGLDDVLPGGDDAAEAPAEEPAEPEATPSESESPAERPTTEEPTDEATEDAPAEEDEGGLLDGIVDSVTSAVAAVF